MCVQVSTSLFVTQAAKQQCLSQSWKETQRSREGCLKYPRGAYSSVPVTFHIMKLVASRSIRRTFHWPAKAICATAAKMGVSRCLWRRRGGKGDGREVTCAHAIRLVPCRLFLFRICSLVTSLPHSFSPTTSTLCNIEYLNDEIMKNCWTNNDKLS